MKPLFKIIKTKIGNEYVLQTFLLEEYERLVNNGFKLNELGEWEQDISQLGLQTVKHEGKVWNKYASEE